MRAVVWRMEEEETGGEERGEVDEVREGGKGGMKRPCQHFMIGNAYTVQRQWIGKKYVSRSYAIKLLAIFEGGWSVML